MKFAANDINTLDFAVENDVNIDVATSYTCKGLLLISERHNASY